jgi:LysR family transcriptional regulator, cys regulon transcriptional activator
MNLHQFRFVQEAVRRNLNLTETAKALYTSQPGVSKAILELEEELGVDIFERHGKRLRRVTEPGREILKSIDVVLREVNNLRRIADSYCKKDAGRLSIATTHTQARYVLPGPISQLRQRYPQVQVELHQGTPEQVAQMLKDESADIGLATETLQAHEELVTLPCYEWHHMLVVPRDHPLAQQPHPTLEQIAREPIVTYHPSVTGRRMIDAAFERAHLAPTIALEALDSDVIKTYVGVGLGVGIVAEMAVRQDLPDPNLVAIPVGHLFGTNVSRIAFKRGVYLRDYVYTLVELLSSRLPRTLVQRALAGGGSDHEL